MSIGWIILLGVWVYVLFIKPYQEETKAKQDHELYIRGQVRTLLEQEEVLKPVETDNG